MIPDNPQICGTFGHRETKKRHAQVSHGDVSVLLSISVDAAFRHAIPLVDLEFDILAEHLRPGRGLDEPEIDLRCSRAMKSLGFLCPQISRISGRPQTSLLG